MRALVVLDTHTYQLAQAHFFAGSGVSLGPLIRSDTVCAALTHSWG